MKNDDLAGILASASRPANVMGSQSTIVQGVITAFDSSDGSNTVVVNGTPLNNVMMLQTGAEVGYEVGDSVLLIIINSTYLILGRVARVGGGNFGTASFAAQSNGTSVNSFTYSSGNLTILSTNVPVPDWADFAVVSMLNTVGFTSSGASAPTQTWANTSIQLTLQGNAAGGGVGAAAGGHLLQTTAVGGLVWTLSGSDWANGLTATSVFSSGIAGTGGYSQLSMTAIYGRNPS